MPQLEQFPDLAKSFSVIKIVMELLDKVTDKTVLGMGILIGLRENKTRQTLQMIKEAAKDNRRIVSNIIGEELLIKIEKL